MPDQPGQLRRRRDVHRYEAICYLCLNFDPAVPVAGVRVYYRVGARFGEDEGNVIGELLRTASTAFVTTNNSIFLRSRPTSAGIAKKRSCSVVTIARPCPCSPPLKRRRSRCQLERGQRQARRSGRGFGVRQLFFQPPKRWVGFGGAAGHRAGVPAGSPALRSAPPPS